MKVDGSTMTNPDKGTDELYPIRDYALRLGTFIIHTAEAAVRKVSNSYNQAIDTK